MLLVLLGDGILNEQEYRRGYVRYGTRFTVDRFACHVCGTKYERFQLGGAHIYAVCEKCNRQDEVGLVFGG